MSKEWQLEGIVPGTSHILRPLSSAHGQSGVSAAWWASPKSRQKYATF